MKVEVIVNGYGKADSEYRRNIIAQNVESCIHYDMNDVYHDIKKEYDNGNISLNSFAGFITNLIRSAFFLNLETEDKFSVSDIEHIDKILFNNIEDMIKSAVQNNLNNGTLDLIMDSIVKTSDIIDYNITDEGLNKIKVIFNIIKGGDK